MKLSMKIEIATKKDLLEIQELANEFTRQEITDLHLETKKDCFGSKKGIKYINSFIKKRNKIIFLAKNSKNKLVGFLFSQIINEWWTNNPKKTEVVMIYISKKYRNKGIGSQLLKTQQEWSKKKHAKAIIVAIHSNNKGSIKFHRREKFKSKKIILEKNIQNSEKYKNNQQTNNNHDNQIVRNLTKTN